jgi:hypothetical protein
MSAPLGGFVIKARTWLSLFIMGVATIAATASCGSDEGTGGGAGSGMVLGDAGSSNAGSSGASGSAGRGSMSRAGAPSTAGNSGSGTGGGDVNTPISNLGATCTSNNECGDGMVCLTVNSTELSGGGPAGGLCTLACTATTDCTAVEPGSDCFNFGTQTAPKLYCLEGCAPGGDETTAPNKCQGRGDFSCVDLSTTSAPETFCLPLCRSDLECGTGLYCNKGSGVCSKTKPTGDPVGAACVPVTQDANGNTVAGSDNCEGFCIRTTDDGVTPVKGVCAEFCSGLLDCGYKGDQPGGLCLGRFTMPFGLFDLGYCLPNCGCTGDCPFPGDLCRAWPSTQQDFATELGAPGLCLNSLMDSVELTCPEAGGAGAGGASSMPTGDAGASGASGASN